MTPFQHVKELEAQKGVLVAEKQAFDEKLQAARLKGGTTSAMRQEAHQIQLKIEAINKELRQANLDLLSKSAGSELLACPFCGGIAALTHDVAKVRQPGGSAKWWYVICVDPKCGCRLARKFSPTEAVRIWQDRKS